MKFTQEQLTKAKSVKSVEELLALAKENGTELTEEEAKKNFAELHKEGELADDELANVSGGCGDDEPPKPLFDSDELVLLYNGVYFRITDRRYDGDEWMYSGYFLGEQDIHEFPERMLMKR